MESSPRVSPQQFAESMKGEFEEFAKQVMEAVNDAPDGQWIAGSEEQVRDLAQRCDERFSSVPCRSGSMRRKPLFPPPQHPTTNKRLANKGRQSHMVLTINGEIKIVRRWWYGSQTWQHCAGGCGSRS